MLKMTEVTDRITRKEFLEFPVRLYQLDKNFIRNMDKDVDDIFNPVKNKFFSSGEASRWLCTNEKQETIGRVAIFYTNKYKQDQPTGGIGFFDCINDQITANFIFDFCREWLQQKGMEAMDGPINFGERDQFWGLLTEGFTRPLYRMNYNFPYYQKLFEGYGFQPYFQQLCFSRKTTSEVDSSFINAHTCLSQNPDIHAERMQINYLDRYAEDFTHIYNAAWANHGEGKQLDVKQVKKMFHIIKPVINEHISWFVYEKGSPVGMWINLPDLNEWFRYLNGKFGVWEKIKFLLIRQFVPNKKMVGLVFGVVPEWQKRGIDGYMIWEGTQHLRKYTHFEEIEMQWIGDFNPKMIKIAENLDTTITRKLTTYRYLFDRNKIFKKHPTL
ncbi:hypothetical protein VO54_03050 [Elizabethkingia miricola]|nr:hypothetical protein VO54_03050 [Elizabethkingia miricola]